ncbi:peptidase domain-containing ABC transporter [Cyclobacterium marinum]|uniref:ABC transporter related protein n=1 Tax=Cyclobacterium marinum (strain ATCC 25205 / DSM 745 / LMG 13164 / NCIMB 1802) TaxID=880070 RepID=G0J579_CYCMS|nr:ATP-binding cassette domain-containing protein [Cyclobacterium marinum]AEL26763.1 ABC transporter related protein [Cyclobacterium marinum DSM 745]MBI0400110.1 ATP-binding cassette domain-containing protein [Cyclobacterium marinum]MBR9774603.1 ATP-binding cassette domain-containing protein [Cytophagales bacterium]|tara:strand:- start:4539 stop:6254 length:1716 start_codon:yes stop_codon:yes gene_type:complete
MNEQLINTPLKRFFSLLKSEKKEIYAIYFYAVLNGLVSLSLPLGIQAILNFILGGRLTTSWVILVIVVALGVIFGGFLQVSQLYLSEKLQQRVFSKSAIEFAYRLPRLKMEALRGNYAPELVNRFFDTINLQKGLSKLLIDFSTASLQVFFGLILLAIYHPFFIIFSLVLVLTIYLIFKFTSPKGMKTSLKESSAKYALAYWLEEIARTLETFKLSGFSSLPFKKVDELVKEYVDFRNSHFAVLIFQFKSLIAFKVLIVVILLVAGSLLLLNNEISIGQFVAAEIIIVLIINSVEKIILSLETVYDTLTATEKLGLIMDMDLERSTGKANVFNEDMSGLAYEFRNLSLQSIDKKYAILNNVNLQIREGEKVVLTGSSGAGKSTLLQVMAGLMEDYQGNVIVNKLPMDTLSLEKLRSMIGDSLSRQSIFHGTIRENITVGKEGVDETKLREVLEIVGLNDFVYRLKDDLETVLLPEGKNLNNSLISKIVLARSLCFTPKLLLLEEELNYLSKEESEKVFDFIFSGPWTLVLVSNRKTLLNKAEKIVVMEAGKVAYEGNYSGYEFYQNNLKNR